MGIFDDPIGPRIQPQQKKSGGFMDFLGEILSRGGDIASRPNYAAGNLLESIAFNASRPFMSDADKERARGIMGGDVGNPLSSLWSGISGKDKAGGGTAVARAYADPSSHAPGWLEAILTNPVTEFAGNLGTDPALVGGGLGIGGKVSKGLGALSNASKAEEAGVLARTAGKLIPKTQTLQNINLASTATGTNPALALPGAALLGAARRYVPKVDELVESLYSGGKIAPEVVTPQSAMAKALADLGAETPQGLMREATFGAEDAARGLGNIGGMDVPVSMSRPKPNIPSQFPEGNMGLSAPQGPMSSLPGQMAPTPALPPGPQMGGSAALGAGPSIPQPQALGRGAFELPSQTPMLGGGAPVGATELRQAALAKALGGGGKSALFSPEMRSALATTGRGATGSFLNKAVVSDAKQLQELLNDPATRVQTLKMLQELVG